MRLMFQPFRKYGVFSGRANRAEFWLFHLFTAVTFVALVLLDLMLLSIPSIPSFIGMIFVFLTFIFGIGVLLPQLAVSVRRLHDRNLSGWLVLIGYGTGAVGPFIPHIGEIVSLAGTLVMIVLFVLPGTKGKNRFGDAP